MDDYISKPYNKAELLRCVSESLAKSVIHIPPESV